MQAEDKGLYVFGEPTDYSKAKTAMVAFAQNLTRKVAPDIRVNVIAPGIVCFPSSSWDDKLNVDHAKV